jgi:phosphatidylserine/phosphatidylglycerophosphate/cardiolipin synthase-like enzyme
MVYIETQYFTSTLIARALIERLENQRLPRLHLVLVMPLGADSPKERLVLGAQQSRVLSDLQAASREKGHRLHLLNSIATTPAGDEVATYIHSKLMIVDDEVLFVGSANLTNRSMGLDTELNLTWNENRSPAVAGSIAGLRASLIAEHCGHADAERFVDRTNLAAALDAECQRDESRLRARPVEPGGRTERLLTALFDPDAPLEHQNWDDVWEEVLSLDDEGIFRRSWETLKRALVAAGERRVPDDGPV